jgi:hypothetical protein
MTAEILLVFMTLWRAGWTSRGSGVGSNQPYLEAFACQMERVLKLAFIML